MKYGLSFTATGIFSSPFTDATILKYSVSMSFAAALRIRRYVVEV